MEKHHCCFLSWSSTSSVCTSASSSAKWRQRTALQGQTKITKVSTAEISCQRPCSGGAGRCSLYPHRHGLNLEIQLSPVTQWVPCICPALVMKGPVRWGRGRARGSELMSRPSRGLGDRDVEKMGPGCCSRVGEERQGPQALHSAPSPLSLSTESTRGQPHPSREGDTQARKRENGRCHSPAALESHPGRPLAELEAPKGTHRAQSLTEVRAPRAEVPQHWAAWPPPQPHLSARRGRQNPAGAA